MGKRMKMTIVLLAALMVIPLGLFAAGSNGGLGIRLGLGHLTDSDLSDNTSVPISLWVDYDIALPSAPEITIRPTLGVIYIKGKDYLSGGSITVVPLMVDGVYHINAPGMSVKPYVGAGIGFAYATSKYDVDEDVYDRYGDYLGTRSVSTTDSSTNFCFNMMGGVEFPMSSTGSIVAQLDYLNFDTDVSSYSVKAFNLSVGYKFRF